MAVSSIADLVTGLLPKRRYAKLTLSSAAAGVPSSGWFLGVLPPASTVPSPGVAGAALTSDPAGIPFRNPTGGKNTYLARIEDSFGTNNNQGAITNSLHCDRLWQNNGFDVTQTTAQTVNSVAWPARDCNGSTNGEDVFVALEIGTGVTNPAIVTTITLQYTNSQGVAGRTGTLSSFPANAGINQFHIFELDNGDTGIRSIQSLTLGTSLVTGLIRLVAFRLIAMVGHKENLARKPLDAVNLACPRLYDNTVLWCLLNGANLNVVVGGSYQFSQV